MTEVTCINFVLLKPARATEVLQEAFVQIDAAKISLERTYGPGLHGAAADEVRFRR